LSRGQDILRRPGGGFDPHVFRQMFHAVHEHAPGRKFCITLFFFRIESDLDSAHFPYSIPKKDALQAFGDFGSIFVMQTNLQHNDKIRKQFDLRANTFDRSVHWVRDQKLLAAHSEIAGNQRGKSLELCCGTGAVSLELKRAGWQVQGVDISEGMIHEASKDFAAVVGDVCALPFPSASFDLAVMRQAYFLLDDGPGALKEVKRVLKPGGKFLLSHLVPFSAVDAPHLRKVHEAKQAQMRRFYTTESLEEELAQNGFAVEKKSFVTVRESVSLWMDQAPELSLETRNKVCDLVKNAPEEYRTLRNVKVEGGEILEDWNFVLLLAGRK
jgi:ubiquinone/menaquinone biosynthesis C-methylase UbiE